MTDAQIAALIRSSVVGHALPQVNLAEDIARYIELNGQPPAAELAYLEWFFIIHCWGTF